MSYTPGRTSDTFKPSMLQLPALNNIVWIIDVSDSYPATDR